MNLYAAFFLFSVIILLYWVIAELFTVMFRLTGLPFEKARFQVMSLLTGCGFTTRESEMMVSARRRREMASVTMLFGYVFNLTVVSALVNVFFSLKQSQGEHFLVGIIIPLLTAAVIIVFLRVPAVRAWTDRNLEKLADRFFYKNTENSITLLDYIGQESIVVVSLKTVPEAFREKPLSQMGLRERQNLLVMLIEHSGKKAEPAGADSVFCEGDRLTVFGNYNTIRRVFLARERFEEQ